MFFLVETKSKDENNTLRFLFNFGLKWTSLIITTLTWRETITVSDDRVCSIGFEKFKNPRYIPCKRSFCHECLSSYIVSQCKSTELRLRFHCPLCRECIPSDGDPNKPEDWAGLFPKNDILQKMIEKVDDQLCEPCLRDNDHKYASDYCLTCNEYLCKLCTKYHKKSMASINHRIFNISEMESIEIVPKIEVAYICHDHQNDNVQCIVMITRSHDVLCMEVQIIGSVRGLIP